MVRIKGGIWIVRFGVIFIISLIIRVMGQVMVGVIIGFCHQKVIVVYVFIIFSGGQHCLFIIIFAFELRNESL